MMDSSTWSTSQPEDIGAVVAVVGTRGWQCRLCQSTFPRSFSIDHHMVERHFHQIQQASTATPSSSAHSTCTTIGSGGPTVNEEGVVRDLNAGNDGTAGKKNDAFGQGNDNDDSLEQDVKLLTKDGGVRNVVPFSNAHSSFASPGESGNSSRRGEGFLTIKQEPGVNTQDASEERMVKESLSMNFDNNAKQGSVDYSAVMGNASSSLPSNTVIHNDDHIVSADLGIDKGSLPPAMECETAHGIGSPKVKRMQKAAQSLKPHKRRTCTCGLDFESKHEFKHHRRSVHCHLKHKTFVCHICGTVYQYKRGLNRHLTDKGKVAHVCSHCPQKFHDEVSLNKHRVLCHSSETAPDPTASQTGVDSAEHITASENENSSCLTEDTFPWECSKCKKHFVKKCAFRKHLMECGIFTTKDEKRCFTCNLCGTSYTWLVDYHRHYVHDHKLAFLSKAVDSPAHHVPLLENSPAPSPVPSVTSEINTAMAGVSLNQANAADGATENIIDLTSQTGQGASVERRDGFTDSTPRALTISAKCHEATGSAASSSQSSEPLTRSLNIHCVTPDFSLTSSGHSTEPLSLASTVGSSNPSLTSTTSSSNPKSLTSEFSSLGPVSLTSTGCSSEQTSEVESIVISDSEDTQSSDSSSDSDDEWEIIMDQRETKGNASAENLEEHKKGDSFREHHQSYFPPKPEHPYPPPPPPHPHHEHSFPLQPPFFGENFFRPHHFPPPPHPHHFHHHHHHHPRFGRGGFFGGFMRGCMFGAARFGPPDWFPQEDSMNSNPQNSENAHTTSSSESAGSSSRPAASNSEQKTSGNSTQTSHSQQHSWADFTPFSHAAHFGKWAGKWKEGKICYKSMWRKLWTLAKGRHADAQFLVCPVHECPQTFTEESALDKHCRESHPSCWEFTCFLCQQPLSQPGAYNSHLREHCDTIPTFGHRGRGRGRGLGRKMFKHFWKWGGPYDMFSPYDAHGSPPPSHSPQSEPEKDSSKAFKECPVCKKKYRADSRESFFERHVNSHYGVEVYSFECEECGKKFLEKGKLTAHQLQHKASPYVCQQCGSSYQSKTSLKRHERIHTGERPHKCPDCGEGFIELRQLERHRSKHTGQDPFQCTVCLKGFTLKDSLLNHVRRQHPSESPVLCCRRTTPLAAGEVEHQQAPHSEAGSTSEAQARSGGLINQNVAENQTESQETAFMELD